ncbi:MAG: hypothetical protein C5B52_02665 [Bacteroidetes bacterium]|nr:MAG: hypothetical protein C5B52_02665 [Bacteroidota bacterium]
MKATFIFLTWFVSVTFNVFLLGVVFILQNYFNKSGDITARGVLVDLSWIFLLIIAVGILSIPYLLVLAIATFKLTRKENEGSIRFQLLIFICLFAVTLIYWLLLSIAGTNVDDMTQLLPYFLASCLSVFATLLFYRKRFLKIKPNQYESNMV